MFIMKREKVLYRGNCVVLLYTLSSNLKHMAMQQS